MKKVISYSMSDGNHFNQKSISLWRTDNTSAMKIARFQNDEAAKLFAEEFNFPLDETLKKRLEDA